MINILSSRSQVFETKWAIKLLENIIKPTDQVLIIGFSFFDFLPENYVRSTYAPNGEYYTKMVLLFANYGIKESQIKWLYYFDDMNKVDSKKLIDDSNIIYYPGGAPDLMVNRLIEKGLFDNLASVKEKTIMGSSAGAMVQLDLYHISPDNEYKTYSLNKGLGYINNLNIEVHYRRRIKQKKGMRKTFKILKNPIITIPDDGLVIVNNNDVNIYNTARLYYFQRGVYKSE